MATVTWLVGGASRNVDAWVAHMSEVRAELRAQAFAGAARARAKKKLDTDRAKKEGRVNKGPHSRITATRGDKLDWFVNLEDPGGAAAAIEFGSRGRPGKHYITGIW